MRLPLFFVLWFADKDVDPLSLRTVTPFVTISLFSLPGTRYLFVSVAPQCPPGWSSSSDLKSERGGCAKAGRSELTMGRGRGQVGTGAHGSPRIPPGTYRATYVLLFVFAAIGRQHGVHRTPSCACRRSKAGLKVEPLPPSLTSG